MPAGLLMLCLCLALGAVPSRAAEEVPELPVLARVGPWPVVSRLIAYDGHLWFANSVKGKNHNSAEIHSYDPASGRTTYRRHLFSQDAGRPLVHGGLLYWPFEDARFSLGWGQMAVTDGTHWASRVVPTAAIYHSHALASQGDRLVAATSAWRAGLQVSEDGGLTWRELYDHPTPDGRVSRITELVSLGDQVIGSLTSRDGKGLLLVEGDSVAPLAGWPNDRAILSLAVHDGALYGLVRESEGVALWRSDGGSSARLVALRADWRPRHLAAGPAGLWAVGRDGLWRSADGRDWELVARLTGGTPWEVALLDGRPYVGGAGADGQGLLWGPLPGDWPELAANDTQRQDPLRLQASSAIDWVAAAAELDRLLADPASYQPYRGVLRERIYELALAGPPAGFFTQRLGARTPDVTLSLIGGAVELPAWRLKDWLLLWAIGLSGQGPVPLALIAEPWTAPANRPEKYFDPTPAALWAIAAIGQDGRATLDALIARLAQADDPAWLTADLVGALTAVTGQPFGHDPAAWRAWWGAARAGWGEG